MAIIIELRDSHMENGNIYKHCEGQKFVKIRQARYDNVYKDTIVIACVYNVKPWDIVI